MFVNTLSKNYYLFPLIIIIWTMIMQSVTLLRVEINTFFPTDLLLSSCMYLYESLLCQLE